MTEKPQEGFVRRLMFHAVAQALREGRPFINREQQLTLDEMQRIVAYAREHGFLSERGDGAGADAPGKTSEGRQALRKKCRTLVRDSGH